MSNPLGFQPSYTSLPKANLQPIVVIPRPQLIDNKPRQRQQHFSAPTYPSRQVQPGPIPQNGQRV